MIENERHPSWVSFVTIFLPVAQVSPLFDKFKAPLRIAAGLFRTLALGTSVHRASSQLAIWK